MSGNKVTRFIFNLVVMALIIYLWWIDNRYLYIVLALIIIIIVFRYFRKKENGS